MPRYYGNHRAGRGGDQYRRGPHARDNRRSPSVWNRNRDRSYGNDGVQSFLNAAGRVIKKKGTEAEEKKGEALAASIFGGPSEAQIERQEWLVQNFRTPAECGLVCMQCGDESRWSIGCPHVPKPAATQSPQASQRPQASQQNTSAGSHFDLTAPFTNAATANGPALRLDIESIRERKYSSTPSSSTSK